MDDTVLEEEDVQSRQFDGGDENDKVQEERDQRERSSTQGETHHVGHHHDHEVADSRTVANDGNDDDQVEVLPVSSCEGDSTEDDEVTETEDEVNSNFRADRLLHTEKNTWIANNCDKSRLDRVARSNLNDDEVDLTGNARRVGQANAHEAPHASRGGGEKSGSDYGDGEISLGVAEVNDGSDTEVPVEARGGDPDDGQMQCTAPTQRDSPEVLSHAGARKEDSCNAGSPLNLQLPLSSLASNDVAKNQRRRGCGGQGDGGAQDIIRSQRTVLSHGVADRAEYDGGVGSDGNDDDEEEHGAVDGAQVNAISQLRLGSPSSDSPSKTEDRPNSESKSRAPSPPRRTGQGSGVFLARNSALVTSAAATATTGGAERIGATGYRHEKPRENLAALSSALEPPTREGVVLATVAQAALSAGRSLPPPTAGSPPLSTSTTASVPVAVVKGATGAKRAVNLTLICQELGRANARPKEGVSQGANHSSSGSLSPDEPSRGRAGRKRKGMAMPSSSLPTPAVGWVDAQIGMAGPAASKPTPSIAGTHAQQSDLSRNRDVETLNVGAARDWLKPSRTNSNSPTCASAPSPAVMATITTKGSSLTGTKSAAERGGWIRRGRTGMVDGGGERSACRDTAEDISDLRTQEGSLLSQSILGLGISADRRALPPEPPRAATIKRRKTGREGQVEESSFEQETAEAGALEEEEHEKEVATLTVLSPLMDTQDVLANGDLSQMERTQHQKQLEANRRIDRLLKSALPGETDAVAEELDEESSMNPSPSSRGPRPCSGGTATLTGIRKQSAFTAGRRAGDRDGASFDSESDPAQANVSVGKQDGLAIRRAMTVGAGRGGAMRGAIVKGKQIKPSAEGLGKQKGGQETLNGSRGEESGRGPARSTPAAYVGGLGSSKSVRKRNSPKHENTSFRAGIPQAQQKSVFSFDSAEDDDDGRVSAKKKRRGDSEPKSAEKLGGGHGEGKGKVPANSKSDLPIRSAGIKRSINGDLNTVTSSRGGSALTTGEKRDPEGKSSVSDTRPGASQQKARICQLSGVVDTIITAADERDAPKRKEASVESSGLMDGQSERFISRDPDVSDVDEDADADEADSVGAGAAAAAEADARAMAEMQRFELTSGSGRDDDHEDDDDDDDRNNSRHHHQVADTAVAPRDVIESRRATKLDTSTGGGAALDRLSAASTFASTSTHGAPSAAGGETCHARPSGTERVVHSSAIATTRYPRRARAGIGSATGVTAASTTSAEAVLRGGDAAYVIFWPCLWDFLKLEGWKCVYSKQKLVDRLYLRPGQSQCSPCGEDGPFKSEEAVCDYVRRIEEIFATFRHFDESTDVSDEAMDGSRNEGNCQSGSHAYEKDVGVRSVSTLKDANATRNGNIDRETADDVPADDNVSGRGRPDGSGGGSTNGRNMPGQIAANRDNPGADASTDDRSIVPGYKSRASSDSTKRKRASVGDGDVMATAQANRRGKGRVRNITSVLGDTSGTDRSPNIFGAGREGTVPSGSPPAGRRGEQLEEWTLTRHREPRHKSYKKDPPHIPIPKPDDQSKRDPPTAGKRRGRPPKQQMTKPVGSVLVARPSSVGPGDRNAIGWIGDSWSYGADPHADDGMGDQDCVQTQEQPELRSALNMMQMEEKVGCMVSSEQDLPDDLANTSDDQITRMDALAGAATSRYTAANRRTEDTAKRCHNITAAVARGVAGTTSAFPPSESTQPRGGQTVTPRPVKRGHQATLTTTAFDPRVSPSQPVSDDRIGGDNGGPTLSRRHRTPLRLDGTRLTSPRSLVLNRGSADRGSSSGDGDGQHGHEQPDSPSSGGGGNSCGLRCSTRRPLSNVGIILTGLSKDYRKKLESLIKAKGGTLITFPSGPGTLGGNYRDWVSCGNSRSKSVNARQVIAVARPGNYRAPKYLFAAAAGVDIVHPSCIEQCTVCLETTNYLLPVGRSALLDRGLLFYPGGYNVHGRLDEISSNTSLGRDYDTWRPNRGRPFQRKSVLIHLGARTPHKPPDLELTLWAAGAEVATIGPNGLGGFLRSPGDSNSDLEMVVNLLKQGRFECFVGLEDGLSGNSGGGAGSETSAVRPHAIMRKQLVRAARAAGVQTGTMEWAAQCILHGRLLDARTCPWFSLEIGQDSGGSVPSLANASRGGNGGSKKNGKGRTTETCFFSYLTVDQDSRLGGRYVAGDYVFLSASAVAPQVGRVESFRRAADGTVKAIVTLMSISVESREISEQGKDGEGVQEVVETSRLGARVIVVAPNENYPCTYAFRDPNVFVQKIVEDDAVSRQTAVSY